MDTPAQNNQANQAKQPGPAAATTVVRLQPASYSITLLYLGSNRIRRDTGPGGGGSDRPPPYRCRVDLLSSLENPFGDMPSAMGLGARLVNVVAPDETGPRAVGAATPIGQGGDHSAPIFDDRHRVMIVDNHGTRTAEIFTMLGSPGGDTISNIKYYKDRGWMPDVWPAVPFRIIVRKYIGDQQVHLDQPIKPVLEIKDPPEEFSQNDGARRRFLDDFFTKYNHRTGSVTSGDDNAPTPFKGGRTHPGGSPGFKAGDVIRVMPYRNQPVVDQTTPAVPADLVGFGDLTAATEHETVKVKFDLTNAQERVGTADVTVGIADFAFMPFPVGGDNYRFLLSLVSGSQDVRDTRENGGPVRMLDDRRRSIPKPRCYVTGKFTIWRKIEFRLCVLCNGLTEDSIRWDEVSATYRRQFIEVTRPAAFHVLTRERWRDHLRQVFAGAPGVNNEARYTQQVFDRRLYHAGFGATVNPTRTRAFSRRVIKDGCDALGIPDPSVGDSRDHQSDGSGLFMLLCRDDENRVSPDGEYFGDRIFWMCRRTQAPTEAENIDAVTYTCAHEFAHVKSLRHSYTGFTQTDEADGSGGVLPVWIGHPNNGNTFPLDHDAADAIECLMCYAPRSLVNSDNTRFGVCGLCGLTLRFYDRIEIQKAANYRNEIIRRAGEARFFELTDFGGGQFEVDEIDTTNPYILSVSNDALRRVELLVLGPVRTFGNATVAGGPHRARPNLTIFPDASAAVGTQFTSAPDTSTPGARLTLQYRGAGTALVRVRATAAAVGRLTLTYRNGGDPTASLPFRIDP